MIVGTTLFKLDGSSYYSPQFSRGGNSATFSIEVLNIGASTTLNVIIEHKNAEDTTWSTLVTFGAITAVGISTYSPTGIKEQLRFNLAVAGPNTYCGVHFNILAPQWRPY
jgi:hypothetical protein